MARIRYLKPEFFEDENLAELPFETRLCFAGLWNFADKAGRLEDRPARLKVKIFPYDKVDLEKCLEALSQPKNGSGKPFIQRYEAQGDRYIQIVAWDKHQKPHQTEKESAIPPAPPLNTKGNGEGDGEGNGECKVEVPILPNVALTFKTLCSSIINDLNEVLGTNYKITSKTTLDLIKARTGENFTLDDFKSVHRKMLRVWGADARMVKYLRPITLYGSKFESYLQMKEVTTKLTETGVKAYLIGQEWLKKEGVEDVG